MPVARRTGREACAGSSLSGLVARIASNEATVTGEIGESAAPASTTSASPSAMSWWAYPMASMPEVQPVETTCAGPCSPCRQATSAARLLGTSAW